MPTPKSDTTGPAQPTPESWRMVAREQSKIIDRLVGVIRDLVDEWDDGLDDPFWIAARKVIADSEGTSDAD